MKGGPLTAVLFDLDGVIVDTAKYHFLAWKQLAGKLGFPFDEAKNERLKGVSRMASLEILLEDSGSRFSEGEKRVLADEKNASYLELIQGLNPEDVLSGILPFLQELRGQGVRTAVCSASQSAGRIIGQLALEGLFDLVLGGGDVSRAKPDPEIFLTARDRLACTSGGCLVVEDAVAGVAAGKAAGMKVVGIGSLSLLCEADLVCPDTSALTLSAVTPLFATATNS